MSSPTEAPETFDELLTILGTGKWNILYIVMLLYHFLLQPGHSLNGVYLAAWQPYTCRPHPAHLNLTVSRGACHYVIERPSTGHASGEAEEVEVPCSQWDYDTSTFTSTLTSDYNWVCDQDYFRALYTSLYAIGTIVSPPVCGYVADRFGRMRVLVASQVILSVGSLATCFMYNVHLILVLRVFVGLSDILTSFVLALEVCEPKHRTSVAIFSGLGWTAGTVVLGGLAYLLRSWRSLQLAITLPTLLVFPLLFLMDESPRWLIVNGQWERAKKILVKAARWNKATLPPDDQLDDLFTRITKEEANHNVRSDDTESSNKGFWRPKLFWNKDITTITLAVFLCYICCSLVFDGLNFAGELYSDNLYLYLVVGGLVEAPGVILAAPLLHHFGRRSPMVACLMGCGVINIALSFLQAEQQMAAFVAAMTGKLLVTSAFQILYLYSNELFPTEVRESGVEGGMGVGQVGACLAPYFSTYLGPRVPWLPSTIYGVISIITAVTTLLLRETKDRPMPETITDLRAPTKKKLRRKMISNGGVEGGWDPDVTTALREGR